MADLVIYGSPLSPFVRKAAATCIEKQVEFEIEPVNVFDPPEWFREISPMKRIPVLRDRSIAAEGRDGTIADSSAICAYIEKKHPETVLYPAEPFAHGRALMLEEYADTSLAAEGGLGIFRPIFFSITQGKEPDVAKAKAAWDNKLPAILDYLESCLGDGPYFLGDEFSIADITVSCCLWQPMLVAELDLSPWPKLAAHNERMIARDCISGPLSQADRAVRKAMPEKVSLV